jgi:peptide/nickel transport system substrate-binding protein
MSRRARAAAHRRWLVLIVAGMVVVSACSSSSSSSAASSVPQAGDTLRIAFGASMTTPDPAIFYENEGLNVIQALYEGLLRYAPNTPEAPTTDAVKIEPLLASEYTVSGDGLTYTFTLRDGVKFHDGTPMDSAAVKASFERFSGVGAGPSYMLADVDSYETPDARTFVIHLKSPVNPFPDFLASPYGPKVMSPTAIKAHEVDGDFAQEWIKTNSAGTGPYKIDSWSTSEYKLTASADYWGTKPSFKNVDIKIIPSFQTQQLQLQQGSLDILINGVLPRDLQQLQSKSLKTFVFDQPTLDTWWINTGAGPFADPKMREALAHAIDRQTIVTQVFADTATLAKTLAPGATLPGGTETYNPNYDPQIMKDLVAQLPADQRKVDIAYATQDPVNQQIADLVQVQLSQVGFDATARAVPVDELFTWPTKPELRADLMIQNSIGDGASPYTWYSLFYAKNGGLNWLGADVCGEADKITDEAYRTADAAAAAQTYVKADQAYAECSAFLPIADTRGIMAYRPEITGLVHPYASQTSLLLNEVRPVAP